MTLPNLVRRADGLWTWRTDPAARDASTAHAGLSVDAYWAMLPRITCPTLLVRGAHSRLLTSETAARMLEGLPDGRLVEVPESSHMVHQENPEGFIAAVRPFLIGGV